MTQVTSVSDEDVLRWSRNLLDRRKVPDLDNFIRLRGITLPDLNDRRAGGFRVRCPYSQGMPARLAFVHFPH